MEDLSFSNSQSEVFEIDQELFAIVVNEIMDNSFKFTSTGEKIQVSSCLSENTYTLIINDFGHRLKAESIGLNDFLMQYNRGHYEQQRLGLGLAIVRMIVQIIKGEISFTNNTPSGISVTISIPINESLQYLYLTF